MGLGPDDPWWSWTRRWRPQVERERSAAAAMLGLPGFVVLAVSDNDGECEQAVETTADLVGCPECGAVAELHDRRPTWVRDLPAGGRPVTLVWVKRVWRCPHSACVKRTWTETSPVIAPRASLTERARAEICRRVGQDAASVAAVARAFGIGWRTAMTAVRDYGTPRIDDPDRLGGVEALGLDETAFAAASATRSTSFVTGIVDLTRRRGGTARLLDVVDDRSASALVSWVNQRETGWRAGIGVAALVGPLPRLCLRAASQLAPRGTRARRLPRRAPGIRRRRRGPLPHPTRPHRPPRTQTRSALWHPPAAPPRPRPPHRPLLDKVANRARRRRYRRRAARPHLDRRPRPPADLPRSRPCPRRGRSIPMVDLLRRR